MKYGLSLLHGGRYPGRRHGDDEDDAFCPGYRSRVYHNPARAVTARMRGWSTYRSYAPGSERCQFETVIAGGLSVSDRNIGEHTVLGPFSGDHKVLGGQYYRNLLPGPARICDMVCRSESTIAGVNNPYRTEEQGYYVPKKLTVLMDRPEGN